MTFKEDMHHPSECTNPPLNGKGGTFFNPETDFETNLGLIGSNATKKLKDGKTVFPYRWAKLYNAKGDINQRWSVTFYVYSLPKNKLVRKQVWIGAQFKTKASRTREGNRLVKEINELLAQGYHIGDGSKPAKTKKGSSALLTWMEAFEWVYQHRQPNLRPRSIQSLELVRNQLRIFLEENKLMNLPVAFVTHELCDEFMRWIWKTRPITSTTWNSYLTYFKISFNYLVKQDRLEISPARKIKALKQDEPQRYSLTPEAKNNLLEAYRTQCKPLYIFSQYIYYTFIRPGELRRLRVADVLDKTIVIPGSASKNRKSEHVMITPAMERLLQQYRIREYPKHFYLIGLEGTPTDKQVYINCYTQRHLTIRRDLELPDAYTLYSWKHTGVVDTYLATLDIEFVSRQCRHSSLDMTKKYLRGLGLMTDYPMRAHLPDLGL